MAQKATVTAGVMIGIVAGVFIGAIGVAWLHPPVDTSAIDNANASVLATAQVEERPVRDLFSMQARVTSETVVPVMPTVTGDGVRQVVSGKVHAPGDILHFGDVVAEVSGRPIFAVPTWLPLYRDITENMEGSDVDALQQTLTDIGLYSGTIGGKAGAQMLNAIALLYTRAGYPAPNPRGLAMGDAAILPADGMALASAAPVGAQLSEDLPLVTVVTAPAVITARVDMIQARGFAVGTLVRVQIGSASPVGSTVVAVGEFQEGSTSQPAGYDVTVAIPDGADPVSAAQEPVIVSESAEVPTGPAVPLTAIRRDAGGASYVLIPGSAGAAPPARVVVSVVGQSAGYAVIREDPSVPIDATVIVTGG